jgi:hypothetical protein
MSLSLFALFSLTRSQSDFFMQTVERILLPVAAVSCLQITGSFLTGLADGLIHARGYEKRHGNEHGMPPRDRYPTGWRMQKVATHWRSYISPQPSFITAADQEEQAFHSRQTLRR